MEEKTYGSIVANIRPLKKSKLRFKPGDLVLVYINGLFLGVGKIKHIHVIMYCVEFEGENPLRKALGQHKDNLHCGSYFEDHELELVFDNNKLELRK